MFKPQRLTFEDLSERLRRYERKYGCSATETCRRFESGKLGDDDLMMWAGVYHPYLTSPHIHEDDH